MATHQCAACPSTSSQNPITAGIKYEILPRHFNQSSFACDRHLGEVVKKAVITFGPVEVKDV